MNLLFSFLFFIAFSTAHSFPDTKSTYDRVVEEILLNNDGTLNIEALEDVITDLSYWNARAHPHSDPEKVAPPRDHHGSSLAIDDYLTLGRQPSTTPFLGLSTMCDICASVVSIGGKVIKTPRVWSSVVDLVKNICPGLTGLPQYVCDGYIDSFDVS